MLPAEAGKMLRMGVSQPSVVPMHRRQAATTVVALLGGIMRRTLAVLVTTAAFVVPAAAASAGQTNASCNNGKGGNYATTGHTDNGNGSSPNRVGCSADETPS
jgi:hypothetical protein